MTLSKQYKKLIRRMAQSRFPGAAAIGIIEFLDVFLLSLFYYFVIVAFAEEFVIRDACTYFLRDASWPLRYLLPNLFFALPHLFNYAGWGEISGEVLLTFLFSGLLGYIFSGCLLQLL